MNFILEDILGALKGFAELIASGVVVVINLLFGGIETALNGVLLLLPSLPETVAPPEFVETINWFFPVGTVVSVATGLLVSYGIFLGIRWLLVKTGVIG